MNATIDESKKLGFVDALRGIAVLMVLHSHILKPYELAWSVNFAHQLGISTAIGFIFITGGWGVQLFFILSGFVLFKPYFLQERSFESKKDVFDFYKRRFFRLYPLLAFNYLVAFFFITKPSFDSFKDLFLTLTTFSVFLNKSVSTGLNPVLATLITEIWFSLLFPLIVYLIYKFGFKKVGISIFVIALVFRLVSLLSLKFYGQGLFGVFCSLDDFFFGMILCKLYYEQNKIFKFNFVKLLFACLILYVSAAFIGELTFCKTFKSIFFARAFIYNLMQISFACLFVCAFQSTRFFKIWFLRILGTMCYSIYVWHYILMASFLDFNNFSIVQILIYSFFMFSFSVMSYRYIEFGKEKSLKKLFLLE